MQIKKINTALISVFHKEKLDKIVRQLADLGVTIFSTGGTQSYIESLGIKVTGVEEVTSYPSILGGRVKTLHPKVFGGILARRELDSDVAQLEEYDIPPIDLVIVDLYPFEDTVASTNNEQDIIEKIDIGGISLIRAAAKNFKDTLVVSSRDQYDELLALLKEQSGNSDLANRKLFALQAFNVSSHYDTAIFNYFNQDIQIPAFKQSIQDSQTLRYGENPHQQSSFFGKLSDLFDKLNGKALSYNNLVDIDAAVHLISEFTEPTFAILKHTNSCGLASRAILLDAWKAALAGDNISAFGGILITNHSVDKTTAEEIHQLFFEVIIAPAFEADALEILKQKKKRIILVQKDIALPTKNFKTLLNGVIEQEKDLKMEDASDFEIVTTSQASPEELDDLIFANKAVKHLKSNTIVLAKDKQLIGMGCGQTSRIDALRQAIDKAEQFGFDVKGAVMASDAFFPFSDCVELAHQHGIRAVVQPGGSIRDKDSIEFCNQSGMTMVTTGIRHFKH